MEIGVEALKHAYTPNSVNDYEKDDITSHICVSKPVVMGPDDNQQRPADNFTEIRKIGEGTRAIDVYINSPYGTFVQLFHIFARSTEKDTIHLYLNSGIFHEDAIQLLAAMDICVAPIIVYVGFINGFYAGCVVAKATSRVYSENTALILEAPEEFLTLRGLTNVDLQIGYMKNSVKRFTDLLIDSGLLSKEEMDDIIRTNKHVLLRREDLEKRLNKQSESTDESPVE